MTERSRHPRLAEVILGLESAERPSEQFLGRSLRELISGAYRTASLEGGSPDDQLSVAAMRIVGVRNGTLVAPVLHFGPTRQLRRQGFKRIQAMSDLFRLPSPADQVLNITLKCT